MANSEYRGNQLSKRTVGADSENYFYDSEGNLDCSTLQTDRGEALAPAECELRHIPRAVPELASAPLDLDKREHLIDRSLESQINRPHAALPARRREAVLAKRRRPRGGVGVLEGSKQRLLELSFP